MFYKETNFKDTKIGRIPKEWEVVKLKNICVLIRGTEPGSKKYNNKGIGFRFIRVSDISKQILEPIFVDEKPENLSFCHKEDVLLTLDGVPGIVAKGMEGAISSGIRIVKPVNKINNDFLFYILQLFQLLRGEGQKKGFYLLLFQGKPFLPLFQDLFFGIYTANL